MGAKADVVLVSHRLPVRFADNKIIHNEGECVSVLESAPESTLWIGYAGDLTKEEFQRKISDFPLTQKLAHVEISLKEYEQFHNGFSNQVIWPAFHDRLDLVDYRKESFESYRSWNQKYCDTILSESSETTPVWIHGYYLMLLPGMIKSKQPNRRVGFSFHIPWPNIKVAQSVPNLRLLAESILKSDVISFQTVDYVRHFAHYAIEEGLASEKELETKIKCVPVGIECEKFEYSASNSKPRIRNGGSTKIIAVDPFDYSKGVDFKLLAFHDFLESNPHLRGMVSLHQLLIPTRGDIPSYEKYRSDVVQLSKYINRKFRQPDWTPVRLVVGHLKKEEIIDFYRQGEVCFVASPADGMNLVSLEYLASQPPEDPGVLLLSNKAGSARYLRNTLQFEASFLKSAANGILQAVSMSLDERKRRWACDMEWIKSNSAENYIQSHLSALNNHDISKPSIKSDYELRVN